jgi:hypothetical protein
LPGSLLLSASVSDEKAEWEGKKNPADVHTRLVLFRELCTKSLAHHKQERQILQWRKMCRA